MVGSFDIDAIEIMMNYYESSEMSVKQKIEKTKKDIPELDYKNIYESDLEIFYSSELPLIESVEVKTKFGKESPIYVYNLITKMPGKISPDVQKAIMRICARLGGFTVERWGKESLMSDAMKNRMNAYLKDHSIKKTMSGEQACYPKVLLIRVKNHEGAPNESYVIDEMVGLMLD